MADDAHDVNLAPWVVTGMAHGLAVEGETFVGLAIDRIPSLQGVVELDRIDADQHIANDRLAGDRVAAGLAATAEALSRLGTEAVGPIGDRLSPRMPHSTAAAARARTG